MSKILFLVGRTKADSWDFQGIFSTQEKAVTACIDQTYFVAPVTLDKQLPHDTTGFPDYYFPLVNPPQHLYPSSTIPTPDEDEHLMVWHPTVGDKIAFASLFVLALTALFICVR